MHDSISYTFIPINHISPEEIQEIKRIKQVYFPEEQNEEKRAEHDDKFCSRHEKIGYVVARYHDDLIGSGGVTKRTLWYHNKKVILGGIGGVFTLENMRRKGIATSLLKLAMAELAKEQCDIAYLCTDIRRFGALYENVSFVVYPKRILFRGKSGKLYHESGGMLAPIKSKSIFYEIMNDNENFDIGIGNW